MIELKEVSLSGEYKKSIRSIRESVFIVEQGIDPEIEFDQHDAKALHLLLYIDNKPVGTGRILDDGHIGRIAILRDYRGQGLGSEIIQTLVKVAVKRGYQRVYLGAQSQAIDFYKKLGFTPFGEVFLEAGIEHLSMEKIVG